MRRDGAAPTSGKPGCTEPVRRDEAEDEDEDTAVGGITTAANAAAMVALLLSAHCGSRIKDP